MSLEQMIEVMQAHLAGRPIQYAPKDGTCPWLPTSKPVWDWSVYDYRAARQVRVYFKPVNGSVPRFRIVFRGVDMATSACRVDEEDIPRLEESGYRPQTPWIDLEY